MDMLNLSPLPTMPTTLLLTLITTYFLLAHLSRRPRHPNEPPIIPSSLPYLGPILALVHQGGYYLKSLALSHASTHPIFTIPLPFTRMYIITSPHQATALQRRPTTDLSFNALLPTVVTRVIGLDAHTRTIISKNLDPQPGEPRGFLAEIHDMLVAELGPGRGMEAMTVQAVRELTGEMEDSVAARGETKGGDGNDVVLLAWVRHIVAPATARLLYGPNNPLAADASLEQAFWDFDHGLGRLLIGVFPQFTARKAYYGREKLVAAFAMYIDRKHYENNAAAQVVQRRIEIAQAHGFSVEAIARSELSFLFAGIVNTATTVFWLVVRIFADQTLLQTVRADLEAFIATAGGTQGRAPRELSLGALARDGYAACPTLLAVYKEVLRLGSNTASTRLVRRDTVLAAATSAGGQVREYTLREGGVVQILGGVMHSNPALWGDDTGEFRPARHLNKSGQGIHPPYAGAFRPFGGGRTICPGRHFATGQILGFVAVVLLRFKIEGAVDNQGQRQIAVPALDEFVLPVHILEPVCEELKVEVRWRGDGGGGDYVNVVP